MQTITDCKSIDLDKHGLIEASAGTGKTYTIENLVSRIIVEKNVGLENILLVTFTEKATGELKSRIRKTIQDELLSNKHVGPELKHLQESLTNFDSASIYTIHGFCQSILRDFSFEQKQLFDFEVVNDNPIYEKMLYEQMRKVWPTEYGESLPFILKISGFPDINKMKGSSQWIEKCLNVSRFYSEQMNHCLSPCIEKNTTLDEIQNEIQVLLNDVLANIGFIDTNETENSKLFVAYGDLNFHKTKKKSSQEKIILPILSFLSNFSTSGRFSLSDLCELFDGMISAHKDLKESGFATLIPEKWNKSGSNLEEKCPTLPQLIEKFDLIRKLLEVARYMLVTKTIKQLCHDVFEYKRKNALISFDDLLLNVANTLKVDTDGHLKQKLRDKYFYVLVDEFQDTDSIQWRIFSEIFLNSEKQHLYLIGDPKQAIYSFRGADIHTYLAARRKYKELTALGHAKLYSLGTNWRSGPGLVNAFNHLFGQETWFKNFSGKNDDENISYSDVIPSDKAEDGISNECGRSPLTLVEIGGNSGKDGLKQMANATANEIYSLVNRVNVTKGDECRLLNYSDFCILVRGKSEVEVIETELNALNIPHSYYKKPGLYQSEEAFELVYLLRAIESPNDNSAIKKALLTPFFDISIEELHNYDNLQHSHIVVKLFETWNNAVIHRKWPQLFQSIIEDTGLLVRELKKSDGERKLTNYKHILHNLEEIASTKNLDFSGIVNSLESYLRQTVAVEYEMDLHKLDSEQTKVKIMTIHSSKGLEFPIVFLIGGFTRSNIEPFYKYNENGVTVFDLAKTSYGKELHKKEQMDEDKRLYYVALTRAKYRVYIPEFNPAKKSAGAIQEFIYDSIQGMKDEWDDNDRNLCISSLGMEMFKKRASSESEDVSLKSVINKPTPVLPKTDFDFNDRMISIESFSSLSRQSELHGNKHHPKPQTAIYMDDTNDKSDDDYEVNKDYTNVQEESNDNQLPRGKHVGNMLHEILEDINFSCIKEFKEQGLDYKNLINDEDSEISQIINKRLILNNLDIKNRDNTAKILWDVLTTPIKIVDEEFMLSDLGKADKVCEMEFYFPLQDLNRENLPEGVKETNGYLTGFIDLVFSVGEQYFIADWKSNFIAEGYNIAGMERVMTESNYHLQYEIYTKAVVRWIKQCLDDKFDYKKHFGGVFYFFLRGMGENRGNGVYYRGADDIKIL